jgi:hypothetical protein
MPTNIHAMSKPWRLIAVIQRLDPDRYQRKVAGWGNGTDIFYDDTAEACSLT